MIIKNKEQNNNSNNDNKISNAVADTGGVKLTKKEIEDIKNFQLDMQKFLLELGDVENKIDELNKYKQQLLNETKKELNNREKLVVDNIYNKYGEGEIDSETWTFHHTS